MSAPERSTGNPHFTRVLIVSLISTMLFVAAAAMAVMVPRFAEGAIVACVLIFIVEGVYIVRLYRSPNSEEDEARGLGGGIEVIDDSY